VRLLAVKTYDQEQSVGNSKSKVWQSARSSGHDRSVVNTTEITGGVEIKADRTVSLLK
jgi:hypothetical protein